MMAHSRHHKPSKIFTAASKKVDLSRTNYFEPEMHVSQRLHQVQPKRQQHFGAARFRDVAQIKNVCPTEALEYCCDVSLGRSVVAANQHGWLLTGFAGLNHDLAAHDVQGFDDLCTGQSFLNFF